MMTSRTIKIVAGLALAIAMLVAVRPARELRPDVVAGNSPALTPSLARGMASFVQSIRVSLDHPATAPRPISRGTRGTQAAPSTAYPAIDAFRAWAGKYAAAPDQEQTAMEAEGRRLARAHRGELKRLIVRAPRMAIEQAVPMVVRQRLPAAVVAELEVRVSGKGSLETYVATPAKPLARAVTQRIVTLGGRTFHAQLYGRRARLTSLPEITVNGVAVDRELAVSEAPARALEIGEIPDPAKQLVQVCPVSGLTPKAVDAGAGEVAPITAETPAAEVGQQVVYLCMGAHLLQLNDEIVSGELYAAEGAGGGPSASRGAFPIGLGASISTGIHKWLYLRVVFPDRRTEPQTEAGAYANAKQLTDFYQEQSYGRLSFQATVAPLIVLPRTEAWYIDEYNAIGDLHPNTMMADAKEAARAAGFYTEDYQHFTLMYSSTLGGFSGVSSVGAANNWVKVTSAGVLEHETGHNLGIMHSNAWNTGGASVIGPGANVEYGNTKDTMGGGGGNLTDGHFNASMKQQVRWLLPENYQTVLQSGVYRIYQFDQPGLDPGRHYALKVAKDFDRDYWLEFRQKLNTNPWYASGAAINWSVWGAGVGSSPTTSQGSDAGTQLLDMTPGSPDAVEDAPLVIGRTFSDFEAGLHITPIGKGGTTPESLDVVVNVGAFPGNQPPQLTLSADNYTIAPGGTVNFTAAASDANGDALAYYWEFGDKLAGFNGVSFSTNNSATQSKTYANAGYYVVQCTVSDLKGGAVKKTLLITVGAPATYTISGTITNGGMPVSDVLVSNGLSGASERWGYSDSDGNYVVSNLAAGSVTLTALKSGYTFSPSGFANPVTVGPNQSGKNFTGAAAVTVSVSAPDPSASESGDTGTFRLTRTGSLAQPLAVSTELGGTADVKPGTDYTLAPVPDTSLITVAVFTIPAGSATLDIIVTPKVDAIVEGPETVVLSLIPSAAGYLPAGPQTATVTIDDANTTLPRVDIATTVAETTEGSAAPGVFTVTRTGSTAAPLTAYFTIDTSAGQATDGVDYTAIGNSVTIPAGAASAVINIFALTDGLAEGMEFVTLTPAADPSYILAPNVSLSATLKINDVDLNTVTLTATDASANENGDPARFTFTRAGSTAASLEVFYSVGGSALHGVDYQALPGFVLFAAGSATATVDILPINDTQGEPTQTVSLQIRSGAGYQFSGTGNAVASLNDDGDLPVVAVGASAAVAMEGASPTSGTFLFTTTGTGGGTITVHYTVSGTATNGVDYTSLNGTLTMAKNTTASLNVVPLNDGLFEDAETVILTITPDPSYIVDLENSATVIIRDDDSVNMVSVSSTTTAMSESVAGKLYFSRAVSNASAVTIHYSVSGTAMPGVDYTALPGTVVIPANTTGVFVTVSPIQDNIAEGNETVIVTLIPDPQPTPTYGIEVGTATLNLADDDAGFTSSLGFALTSLIKPEDAGTIFIDVTRTGDTSGAASVEYGFQNGSATGSGVDFICPPGRLDFAPGDTVKSIPLTIIDDNIPEDIETVVLQLRNASGAALIAAASQCTLAILDNEPRVSIEATDPFAYETGKTALFTVRRYGTTAGALSVPISTSGTAVSGTDYVALPATVSIPSGSASTTLALTPKNNPVASPVKTVIVSLGASGNVLPGPRSSATAWLGDAQSNNPPLIQIVSPRTAAPFVPAGVGLSIHALVADDGPAASLTISWSKILGPGTATFSTPAQADTDVTFSANGTYQLQLSANDGTHLSTGNLSVTVGAPIAPWTNADIGSVAFPGSATEQYGIHSLNVSGAILGGIADSLFLRSRHLLGDGEIRARVRFMPNIAVPRVGVMLRESTAAGSPMASLVLTPFNNNADLLNYRVTADAVALSGGFGTGITISYWVRMVRSGNNFSAYDSPDGVAWTQRGSTQAIPMAADILAGLVATAGSATRIETSLVDNVQFQGVPDNTAPSVDAGPDGGAQINLSSPLHGTVVDDGLPSLPGAVTAHWSQRSGPGAAAFADASAADTAVTFPTAGTYVLRLSADDGEATTFDEATFTVTAPVVTIAPTKPLAAELGLTPGEFTISRTGSTAAALTVFFAKAGTATEGADYQALGAQAVIPAGAASVALAVTPLADTLAEGDETVALSLTPNTTYVLGASSNASVTIKDLPVDDWRRQNFTTDANTPAIAGDNADPNHNGLVNLLEYALGLDPKAVGAPSVPVLSRTASAVSLTFTHRLGAADVSVSVEWSDDLSPLSWSTTGVSYVATPLDGTRETVQASVPTDATVPQRFLRLKVTRP